MADGRILKRKISTDGRVGLLSAHSALLYSWSIPHLDREGRMPGAPVAVRGAVVPALAEAHPDEWTDERVASYIAEWTVVTDEDDGLPRPLVLHYCVRGVWVCQFLGFQKNQKLRWDRERPSSLPAPPPMLLEGLATAGDAVSPNQLSLDATRDAATPLAEPFPATSRQPPGLEVQAEAQVQEPPADQRQVSRARADRENPAALLGESDSGGEDPLAGIAARVEARRAALGSHGPLARLLEVLPDADAQTPAVLHSLFDPLGEMAIELAREEILLYGDEVRRPAAYAVGIGQRLAEQAAGVPESRRRRGARVFASLRDERAELLEGRRA